MDKGESTTTPAPAASGTAAAGTTGDTAQLFPTEHLLLAVNAMRGDQAHEKGLLDPEDPVLDKARSRKTTHSAIERRRRDRINEKINALRSIVPACANQENLHKVSILEKVLEYIQGLVRDNDMLKRECHSAKIESTRYREKLGEPAQPHQGLCCQHTCQAGAEDKGDEMKQ